MKKVETGIVRKHDHWWWVNPNNMETYGPFDKRSEARDHAKMIRELDEKAKSVETTPL